MNKYSQNHERLFSLSLASRYAGPYLTGVGVGLTWLAFSVALYSFPTLGDAKDCWRVLWIIESPWLMRSVVGVPLAGMMYFSWRTSRVALLCPVLCGVDGLGTASPGPWVPVALVC